MCVSLAMFSYSQCKEVEEYVVDRGGVGGLWLQPKKSYCRLYKTRSHLSGEPQDPHQVGSRRQLRISGTTDPPKKGTVRLPTIPSELLTASFSSERADHSRWRKRKKPNEVWSVRRPRSACAGEFKSQRDK